MNCQMVLYNTNKNNSILLEVFASVFTVSSYFTDNPRTYEIGYCLIANAKFCKQLLY